MVTFTAPKPLSFGSLSPDSTMTSQTPSAQALRRLPFAAAKAGFVGDGSADGAALVGASLDGAALAGAALDGASLDGAALAGAALDGASLDGAGPDVVTPGAGAALGPPHPAANRTSKIAVRAARE
ncbi:pentapeptide repeat-containing protein [Actinoplanes sp. NBRC 103695]|uniref:pentapeptide repeat-containing protein n=1 Tax=Actinoplanes sp. NBRC 103695 TaxID=3032202 RepID=UPI0024A4DDF0|nr:pentapeptide repeat-containing protein [Actinoplanes sp. NBRC 103695]GLY99379.1 hypothetical protein Acsp02_66320 [Actinoplanes sp. NBRC 103695]